MKKKVLQLVGTLMFILIGCVILGNYSDGNKVYAAYDTTAPVVNSISFNSTITKPGVLNVSFNAIEEETGIIGIDVYFYNKENSSQFIGHGGLWNYDSSGRYKGDWSSSPKFSGTYSVNVAIPSSARSGEWELRQIKIMDQAQNVLEYIYVEEIGWTKAGIIDKDGNWIPVKISVNGSYNAGILKIKDEFNVNFQTYITNPNITSKINSMPEGQACMINFDNSNHIAKKEWFDAIRGKNKTIVFSNDGIQWIINGRGINSSTKDIKLKVSVKKETGEDYGTTGKVLLLGFESNGTLPGPMKVRVKSNYVLGSNQNLYYYNNDNISLESNTALGYKDGDNIWSEMVVTHNSNYILSENKLINSPKNLKLKVLKGKKLQVKWKKVSGVKKYKVTYSTSKKFTKKTTKTITVKSNKATLKKLKKGKKYYVKVCAVKTSRIHGIYSTVKTSKKIK